MKVRWALLVAAGAVAAPFVLTGVVERFLLAQVAAIALAAVGLGFLSGIAGQLSLGHGALMSAGAYTSALLVMRAGWPFELAAVAGVVAAVLVGLVFALPSLRVGGQYLALVTLGLAYIAFQLEGSRQLEGLTGGFGGLPGIPLPNVLGRELGSLGVALLAAIPLAVAVLFVALLRAAAPGRAAAAIRESERGAAGSGIDPLWTKVTAFAFSALCAGAGGVIFAHSQGLVTPEAFGLQLSLLLLVMVVIGGARTPIGPAVGAAVVLLPRALSSGFTRYELVIFGGLALLVVVLLPAGLTGWGRSRRGGRDETARFDPAGIAMAAGPAAAVSVRDITVRFGGLTAVSRVSFDVAPGTIHGLIGPNGSGKTSLVDACTGLVPRGGGVILVDGRPVGRRPRQVAMAGVARTFQDPRPFPGLSCLEVVQLGATHRASEWFVPAGLGIYAWRERDLREDSRELLAAVGLHGLAGDLAGTLSLGEAKRLELARALAARPRVLFLDEPAAGLAEGEVEELARFLDAVRTADLTIVVVEHHMEFLLDLADAVTVLDSGRVISSGPPDEVRGDQAVLAAYLG